MLLIYRSTIFALALLALVIVFAACSDDALAPRPESSAADADGTNPREASENRENNPPDTELLIAQSDPYFRDDTHVYPYFEILRGPYAGLIYPFAANDTVPDGARVVFKAIGRDHPDDIPIGPAVPAVDFQGVFTARQRYEGGGYFTFSPEYSDLHRTPEWTATTPDGWSSDTLSFLVGPFEYELQMRSVDEHGLRDPTPAAMDFVGNYPPCIQCIELLNLVDIPEVVWGDPCYIAECFADTARFFTSHLGGTNPERNYLSFGSPAVGSIWYKISTGEVYFEEPDFAPETFDVVPVYNFTARVALHGKESNDLERSDDPSLRVMDWTYQIDHENDPDNTIREGEGADVLGIFVGDTALMDYQGIWFLQVKVAIPLLLQVQGPTIYYNTLLSMYGQDFDNANAAWDLTTRQIGYGTVTALATDAGRCEYRFAYGKYWYFDGVRVPPDHPGRSCVMSGNPDWNSLDLWPFRTLSETVVLPIRFGVETDTEGDYFGGPPPN